jgi:hypothetical protein
MCAEALAAKAKAEAVNFIMVDGYANGLRNECNFH